MGHRRTDHVQSPFTLHTLKVAATVDVEDAADHLLSAEGFAPIIVSMNIQVQQD